MQKDDDDVLDDDVDHCDVDVHDDGDVQDDYVDHGDGDVHRTRYIIHALTRVARLKHIRIVCFFIRMSVCVRLLFVTLSL